MAKKRTAREKRDLPQLPEIKEGPEAWNQAYGGTGMLISTPLDIDKAVREIPKGKLLTMSALRQKLAAAQGADYTCPLTTGIFLRIAAEAAEEERALGQADIAPWWRVVRDDGTANDKLPGKGPLQIELLAEEGIHFAPKPRSGKLVVQSPEAIWEG